MIDRAHRLALELAVEDLHGLWEIAWRIKTTDSRLTFEEAVGEARRAVLELHRRGLLELFQETPKGKVQLADSDIEAALSGEEVWREPKGHSAVLLVGATEQGDQEYFSK